jgi:hypothetical protein
VAVNCGALPATLVESLLFGHKRGAFSGAAQDELGLVRSAEGGTLFLDEVADLRGPAQAALLRVLQEREVLPVGATRPIATDVRVLAATHRPVESLSAQEAFRADLLARLSGFTFTVPPLRDRIDDLGLLVSTILSRVAPERAAGVSLSSELVYAMLRHDWPFNAREVEQRLRTAVVLAFDGRIQLSHAWTSAPSDGEGASQRSPRTSQEVGGHDDALRRELEAQLTEHGGNVTRVSEAARQATHDDPAVDSQARARSRALPLTVRAWPIRSCASRSTSSRRTMPARPGTSRAVADSHVDAEDEARHSRRLTSPAPPLPARRRSPPPRAPSRSIPRGHPRSAGTARPGTARETPPRPRTGSLHPSSVRGSPMSLSVAYPP